MTVLSRGARVRRGGRRPGWLLLTALLVLAIGASSALVFTNRVELLKLAVILALWAAVVAAFVSVIYRRQSDVDQARVRDLKLVYDLQLDREISARREYELTVESQLRRELASELRAQAADEVAALRAELSALRTNLEILFDTDLNHRPALETERTTVRGYSEWDREPESPRDRVNRVASVRAEQPPAGTDDSAIIDVPEEPLLPPPSYQGAEPYRAAPWQQPERNTRPAPDQQPSAGRWTSPEPAPPSSGWAPQDRYEPQPQPRSRRYYEPPPPPPPAPEPPPMPPPQPQPAPPPSATDWQPVSNWAAPPERNTATEDTSVREPTLATPPPAERRGRHSSSSEPGPTPPKETESGWQYGDSGRRARARHSAEASQEPSHAAPVMSSPQPAARHRSAEAADADGPQTGGQSVAELLARLQATPTGGGRRRRRED
ncbi:DUF6779 domain-containing protein [Mycobacterium branderi]|uniref:Membrane protein n=1 Tax=Mycobacterium branderi TaxID=43348 RepID=A0A7I7W2E5_9MYCO|nr:DUF6779 domain-containing protein [Mycobacterium branderi]MCV7233799.1 hypothetical protein [Mycobacterium branderi]ORA39771.1 hypothetical protein BST20_09190 [Mycobacterium branderi]BBZ11764.1 membrane protein [Mycobacterium branderi]